jgi:cyanophycinase
MAQVIVTNPGSIGIGIEEDSAIIVRNGLDAEVIGSGLVILIDGLNITDSNVEEFTSDEPISIRNLRVDILKRGDKIILPLANPPHY